MRKRKVRNCYNSCNFKVYLLLNIKSKVGSATFYGSGSTKDTNDTDSGSQLYLTENGSGYEFRILGQSGSGYGSIRNFLGRIIDNFRIDKI
jgi:hypothetical protein